MTIMMLVFLCLSYFPLLTVPIPEVFHRWINNPLHQQIILYHELTISLSNSKRAFQNQIKKWHFRPHRIPASKNFTLIETVKELWEQHVLPTEMLRILNEEMGFEVKKKELNNLRHSHDLYFRAPNVRKGRKTILGGLDGAGEDDEGGDDAAGVDKRTDEENEGDADHDQDLAKATIAFVRQEDSYLSDEMEESLATVDHPQRHNPASFPSQASTHRPPKRKRAENPLPLFTPAYPSPLPADIATRRALKDDADAAKAASIAVRHQRRHRHRRTPVDIGANTTQGPRFPSEMTLEEAKTALDLDKDTYRAVRDAFEEICVSGNIVRKKGSGKWQAAKEALVASFPALHSLFNVTVTAAPNAFTQVIATGATDRQIQALDILCMDVTKQMRNRSVRMSVTKAKKMLGLDPTEVTRARAALTERLLANGFVSKTECGEYWKVMRDEWIAEQELNTDAASKKAADVLCADVMKRINDDRTKEHRLQITEDKKQSLLANGKETRAGDSMGEEENQSEVEPPGGYISRGVPTNTVYPQLQYPPGGYISLPLPLSVVTSLSVSATAVHHPAPSSAIAPQQTTITHGGYRHLPNTYTPYATPADGFQHLYPEIDPEILAMNGYEKQA